MQLYRRRIDNPLQYDNRADYGEHTLENPPFEAGEGFEWAAGDLPAEAVPMPEPKSLNQTLEETFLGLLPTHLGQSYLTQAVISDIMQAKVALVDANRIDPSGLLGKAILLTLSLPTEMEADRQSLLALFP